MIKSLSGFALFFLISCTGQETIKEISSTDKALLKEFEKIPNSANLQMVKSDEPGKKLTVCLTFVNKETKAILVNQRVRLYQTSENGEYNPDVEGDETTARIKAEGFTDVKGRLYVKTILPGSYATSGDNRHIHTRVYGAKPRAYDIHFNQHTNAQTKRFIQSNDQFFLGNLKYTDKKELICFLTVEVKNPK